MTGDKPPRERPGKTDGTRGPAGVASRDTVEPVSSVGSWPLTKRPASSLTKPDSQMEVIMLNYYNYSK